MRVLLGPTNFARQPELLADALRARGHAVHRIEFRWASAGPAERTACDLVVPLALDTWLSIQMRLLEEIIDLRPDVVHLWNRSLVGPPGAPNFFSGLDLPFLRAAGIRVVFRFTGYDIRGAALETRVNPESPRMRGLQVGYEAQAQERYLAHLAQWVDAFVVQDPELREHAPDAVMIARAADLAALEPAPPRVGGGRVVVAHAPTDRELKGTGDIVAAVDRLRDRGLRIEFDLIEGVGHAAALARLRRADVVVDQLRLGWYGVVAVEAMALGKPVVAHVRPDLTRQLDDPPPIVPATGADVEARLEELVRDPVLRGRLGAEGRAYVERVHACDRIADQVEALYGTVLAAPPSFDASPRYFAALAEQPLDVWRWALRFNGLRARRSRAIALWRRRRRAGFAAAGVTRRR